jgi:hypothetical protein
MVFSIIAFDGVFLPQERCASFLTQRYTYEGERCAEAK